MGDTVFCPNCEYPIDALYAFCPHCGCQQDADPQVPADLAELHQGAEHAESAEHGKIPADIDPEAEFDAMLDGPFEAMRGAVQLHYEERLDDLLERLVTLERELTGILSANEVTADVSSTFTKI